MRSHLPLGVQRPDQDTDFPEISPSRLGLQDRLGNAAIAQMQSSRPDAFPHQSRMERAFGQDFSGLTVRLGQRAALDVLGADAAAEDGVLRFASSNPGPEEVAHELAHIAQGRARGERDAVLSDPADAGEREAERVAEAAARGEPVRVQQAAPAAVSRHGHHVQPRGPRPPDADHPGVPLNWDVALGPHAGVHPHRLAMDGENHEGLPETSQMSLRDVVWENLDQLTQRSFPEVEDANGDHRVTPEDVEAHIAAMGQDPQAAVLRQRLYAAQTHAVAYSLNPTMQGESIQSTRYMRRRQGTGDHAGEKGATTCNFYARDFATMMGATLPSGNANDLNQNLRRSADWSGISASQPGHPQTANPDMPGQAQRAANDGSFVVLSAAHEAGHGHISVVLPELAGDLMAHRDEHGRVDAPLQSMSGGDNHMRPFTNSSTDRNGAMDNWWIQGHEDGAAFVTERDASRSIFASRTAPQPPPAAGP